MRLALFVVFCGVSGLALAADLNVAVVTGGHEYEAAPFNEMFNALPGMKVTQLTVKDGGEIFEDISKWPYDVLVMYNLSPKITEKQQENFKALLNKGMGLVVLHHAIANYADWPEYRKIIGARYFLKDIEENGNKYPRSQYKIGVDIKVNLADAKHPAVAGLNDFQLNDETYKGYLVDANNHLLLTTDNPISQKEIGWTRTYGKAKVCYIQMGHDKKTYVDPNYRKLVTQAIQWSVAK